MGLNWKKWGAFTIWMVFSLMASHYVVVDAFHLSGVIGQLANWGLGGAITLYGWEKYIKKATSGL